MNRLAILLLATWLTVGRSPGEESSPARLATIGAPTVLAQLEAVTAAELLFTVEGQPRRVAWNELVSWGSPRDSDSGPQWLLVDEGLLIGDVARADDDSVTLDSTILGNVKLPLERLRGALFRVPWNASARDRRCDAILSNPPGNDRLWLANGDELSGTLRRLDRQEFEMASQLGDLKVPRSNLTALAFDPALADRRSVANSVEIGLSDGSRFVVSQILIDARTAQLQRAGEESRTVPRDAIVWISANGPHVKYLTQLDPGNYRHVPYLDTERPYQVDRNLARGQLRVAGRLSTRGLGMPSASSLTWSVPTGFRRFAASVGIDDETQGGGSVVFRVFLDGREAYASPVVRGHDSLLDLAVELGTARTLTLIVDYAEQGDVLDHADWLEARLEK